MNAPQLKHVLAEIFDAGVVSRDGWADALGVSTAALSQWVNGRSIPDADHLGAVLLLVRQDDRLPDSVLPRFESVLDRPIGEVLERPRPSMGPTLRHFLLRPHREGTLALLDALPPHEQEELLVELGDRVQARLEQPVGVPKVVADDPITIKAVQIREQGATLPMVA